MKRHFKGVWIPAALYLSKELKWPEKILLIEIDSLSRLDQGCFASNSHFAEHLNLSVQRTGNIINKLAQDGYIQLEYETDDRNQTRRTIYPAQKLAELTTPLIFETPLSKTRPPLSKTRPNNTNVNNTKTIVGLDSKIDDAINYLNMQAGKNFRTTSKKNRSLVRTLLNDNYTLDDIKQVIDDRCNKWLSDPKFVEYLRPSTIFRPSNFEKYLNSGSTINYTSDQDLIV